MLPLSLALKSSCVTAFLLWRRQISNGIASTLRCLLRLPGLSDYIMIGLMSTLYHRRIMSMSRLTHCAILIYVYGCGVEYGRAHPIQSMCTCVDTQTESDEEEVDDEEVEHR